MVCYRNTLIFRSDQKQPQHIIILYAELKVQREGKRPLFFPSSSLIELMTALLCYTMCACVCVDYASSQANIKYSKLLLIWVNAKTYLADSFAYTSMRCAIFFSNYRCFLWNRNRCLMLVSKYLLHALIYTLHI